MSEELSEVDFGVLKRLDLTKAGYRLLDGRRWKVTINKDWLRGIEGESRLIVWRGEGTLGESEERHDVQDFKSEGFRMSFSEQYVCGDYVRSVFIQTIGAVWVK